MSALQNIYEAIICVFFLTEPENELIWLREVLNHSDIHEQVYFKVKLCLFDPVL